MDATATSSPSTRQTLAFACSALGSREFRALLAARLVSTSGSSVAAIALTFLIYQHTGSPLQASLAFALTFLPYLFGGTVLLGLVDRVRPRRLATTCDAMSALLAGAMALPRVFVAVSLALLFGIGALSTLSAGAATDLVRSTVSFDAYVPARSLLRLAAQSAQIGGNALGVCLSSSWLPAGCCYSTPAHSCDRAAGRPGPSQYRLGDAEKATARLT